METQNKSINKNLNNSKLTVSVSNSNTSGENDEASKGLSDLL